MEKNELFSIYVNQMSRAICWIDGNLDENELEAGCKLGKLFVPDFNEGLFRFVVTKPFKDDENEDVRTIINSLKAARRLFDEEQLTVLVTFATTLVMADGEIKEEEKRLVDEIATALGFDSVEGIYNNEEDLKKAKKEYKKTLLSSPELVLNVDAKTNLLASVRALNPRLSANAFNLYFSDAVEFFNRGCLYQLLAEKKMSKEHEATWAGDIALIKKSKISDKLKNLNFLELCARLKQPGFDFLSASILSKDTAAYFSCLADIFRCRQYSAFQEAYLPKKFKKPQHPKKITYKNLVEWLCTNFGWNKDSFSNGCGKIDMIDGHPGLMPNSGGFLKNLFKKPKGNGVPLNEILVPNQTYLKFKPEALVSILNSRDANFWLMYFKEEIIYMGRPDNDVLDIFGLPVNEMMPEKGASILNKDLLFLGFTPDGQGTQCCVLDLESQEMWRLPTIVFYGCRAIEIS